MQQNESRDCVLKTRIDKEVREEFLKIATENNLSISEALRIAVHHYIKKQGEVDNVEDRFTEKVQALHILSHKSIEDCRRAIIEAEGNGELAFAKLQDPNFINDINFSDGCCKNTRTPEKIQFHFTKYGIQILSHHKGEIEITPEELILANNFNKPIARPNYNGSHECKLNYIEFICPRKPTARELYDAVFEYIESLIMLIDTEDYQLDTQISSWFSPQIAAQEVERILYDIIELLEPKAAVAQTIYTYYLVNIRELYLQK